MNRFYFIALGLVLLGALAFAAPGSMPGMSMTGMDAGHGGTSGFSKHDLDMWTHETLVVATVILYVAAISTQFARNFFLRALKKFTLRLGADIWWLSYILIRDGLMLATLLVGLIVLHTHILLGLNLAVPFLPLSMVFLAAGLYTKLVIDTDEDEGGNALVTWLLFFGVNMQLFSLLMVMEVPETGFPFQFLRNVFSSTLNPSLAMMTWFVTMAGLGLIALLVLLNVIGFELKLPKNVAGVIPNLGVGKK